MTTIASEPITQVCVDRTALIDNFHSIKDLVGDSTAVSAVVKADAYGHGLERAAEAFHEAGCRHFCVASLEEAGLSGSALAREWIEAGERSAREAVNVSLPFSEAGFLPPEEPEAVAYRVEVGRGQRLTMEVELDGAERPRVFLDLFRVPGDPRDPLRPVLSTDSVPGSWSYEPYRGGEFVLRLQPELLRGGRFDVTLRLEAQLAFPVADHDVGDILSVFGVPRDGGRRSHHGVDIFARRGTPVVATSPGIVRGVRVTNLGGKVVWLRDPARNASMYYAHLDSQTVDNGDRVETGDTLGFVGNSGNAITTPPHLHFGIYRRGDGPVDPDPFIRRPRPGPPGRVGSDGEPGHPAAGGPEPRGAGVGGAGGRHGAPRPGGRRRLVPGAPSGRTRRVRGGPPHRAAPDPGGNPGRLRARPLAGLSRDGRAGGGGAPRRHRGGGPGALPRLPVRPGALRRSGVARRERGASLSPVSGGGATVGTVVARHEWVRDPELSGSTL